VTRSVLVLASFLALLAGCSKSAEPERCPEVQGGAPVDPALLAFLSRARAAHHRADEPERRGDLPGAIRELEALVGGPLLRGNAPESREVLADTRARLADLRSRAGDYDRAEADITEGLRLVPETSYFRGHLLEVRGLSEERRSKALSSAGDTANAERAKNRALTAFQEAMAIQAEVIERSAPPR
jgi:tetratricopeptide (TPR) repeat protein